MELNIQKNIPLAPYTTFGIGGPADYFIKVQSIDELIKVVHYSKENNLPYFILGTGANILIGDKGFRGIVIKNEANKLTLSSRPSEQRVEGFHSQEIIEKMDTSIRSSHEIARLLFEPELQSGSLS